MGEGSGSLDIRGFAGHHTTRPSITILLTDSIDSLKTVYSAYFQSSSQFAIIFCGTTTNLHKALILQKRIIRVMLGF
jgi:hypothetical protein